jgi:nucleoside 2-deoxyribosyltransferase
MLDRDNSPSPAHHKGEIMKVYLAGNLHRAWRERLIAEVGDLGIIWLRPLPTSDKARLGGGDKDLYFVRDITQLRQSNLFFGLIENYDNENNRHSGLSAEIGIAHALGIPIILVNLLPQIHSFEFIEKLSDSVFYSWEDGISALRFAVTIPK